MLLEAINDVKKDDIKLNKGINLFERKNNNCFNILINEENINIVVGKIDIIKEYFKDQNLWCSINQKYKILEEKKNEFMFKNTKNELEKKLKQLTSVYRKILMDDNFKFLYEMIKEIENDIRDNINKKDIEKKLKI